MHMRGYSRHAVSVCVCVCLSVTFMDHVIVKTNEHNLRNFFTFGYPHHSSLSTPNGVAIFRREPPPTNGGAKCRWGIGRNRDSGLIAGYRRLLDVQNKFEDIFIRFDATHERDRHTDTQTPHNNIGRAYASHRAAKRLRSTFCIEAIQTRSIARPLCDSRASCYTGH